MLPRVSCSERPITAVRTALVAMMPLRSRPRCEDARIKATTPAMVVNTSGTMRGRPDPEPVRLSGAEDGPAAPVRGGKTGRELIPVLRDTGLTMLIWSVAVAAALGLTG